jgi:DNA-directed RNA polymerase specialized sigma24 family protein
VADEEDVVIAAFAGFCEGVEAGRFAHLADRDDLWQVLVLLTERRAVDQKRRQGAAKRGARRIRGESVFAIDDSGGSPASGISRIAGHEPTPAFAAETADQLRTLLAALEDDTLQQVALAKLEARSNEDIAQQLGTSLRTVERRLSLIRRIWEERLGEQQG